MYQLIIISLLVRSYSPFVKQMDSYLSKYENTNGTRKCDGTMSNKDAAKGDFEEVR